MVASRVGNQEDDAGRQRQAGDADHEGVLDSARVHERLVPSETALRAVERNGRRDQAADTGDEEEDAELPNESPTHPAISSQWGGSGEVQLATSWRAILRGLRDE